MDDKRSLISKIDILNRMVWSDRKWSLLVKILREQTQRIKDLEKQLKDIKDAV